MKQLLPIAALATLLLGTACSAPQAMTLPDPVVDEAHVAGQQTIVLAGGCFWGVEGVFDHVQGVTSAVAGYAGGAAGTATYDQVSTGTTGHAESVQVTYDPNRVTLGQLLKIYFAVVTDPTELNRQGPDSGTQYRGAIFTSTPEQQKIAAAYIAQLQTTHSFTAPVMTQVTALDKFYPAEDHHQHYLRDHPDSMYIVINDAPKVAALRAEFPDFYKD